MNVVYKTLWWLTNGSHGKPYAQHCFSYPHTKERNGTSVVDKVVLGTMSRFVVQRGEASFGPLLGGQSEKDDECVASVLRNVSSYRSRLMSLSDF